MTTIPLTSDLHALYRQCFSNVRSKRRRRLPTLSATSGSRDVSREAVAVQLAVMDAWSSLRKRARNLREFTLRMQERGIALEQNG